MLKFLAKKIPSVLLVLFATSVIAFLLPRMAPGDPAQAIAGSDATADQVAAIRAEMGLDKSLLAQYLDWLGGFLRGDLGMSFVYSRPVSELILDRAESTIELALLASVFMIVLGIGLGVMGGGARSRTARFVADGINTLLIAIPAFVVGLLLIIAFGVVWRLLPVSGEVPLSENFGIGFQYLLLPALALGLALAPGIARLLQTTMLATQGEDFVDLARAKGASRNRIVYRHVLRTSLGASIVAIGMRFGELFGGAIIIEAIFARNGLGQLVVQAVNSRDYLLVQVLIMAAVLIAVVSQLLTEVILAAMDPRIRLEG